MLLRLNCQISFYLILQACLLIFIEISEHAKSFRLLLYVKIASVLFFLGAY